MTSSQILFVTITIVYCATFLQNTIDCAPTISSPSHLLKNHGKSDLIYQLERQIKSKEQELQNAETINKNFEKMIQLVNILGQVDNFLTDRTKAIIKKLAVLVDDENKSRSSHDEDD